MQGSQEVAVFERAREARQARLHLARKDPCAFIEMVLRDEKTGHPVVLAPLHVQWHRAVSRNIRTVLLAHVESGKTQQLTIGRTLWELGVDPNIRVALVSNTYGQAEKNVRAVGEYIKGNDFLHTIFPELTPGEPWTHSQLTLKTDIVKKDPSVQAVGVHGNILGARLDLVILDDVLDFENTLTPKARQDLWDWYQATIASRLTAEGRVIAVGTAWNPDDILHRWEKTPGWIALRFPVLDVAGNPTWPERWSLDRIELRRSELGPLEFARQMLCKARDDSEARFKQDWLDLALLAGKKNKTVSSAWEFWEKHDELRPPWWDEAKDEEKEAVGRLMSNDHEGAFYTGVDLAVQRHSTSDRTVLFTIYVGKDRKRQVVEILSGRWTGPEIVDKIISVHDRFGSIVIVENVAAQDFILQFVRDREVTVPVLPFTTGKNKAHPEFGIETLAAEFAAGKWIVPSHFGTPTDKDVFAWIQEMLEYDPRGHTGDRLMACWFARELAHRSERTLPEVHARIVGV